VVESAWLASWLSFVHADKGHAPCPGPCRNDRLIRWNTDENKYVGRRGLIMSSSGDAGDFRRVTRETWLKYQEFYPESGPTITIQYTEEELLAEPQVCTFLEIVDPPPPPAHPAKSKKRKLKPPPIPETERANSPDLDLDGPEEKCDESASESESVSAPASVDDSVSGVNPMTLNQPKVVSNLLPPRNLAVEQYAKQAVESSIRGSTRERDSDDEEDDDSLSQSGQSLVSGQGQSSSAYAGTKKASDKQGQHTLLTQKKKPVSVPLFPCSPENAQNVP
jgi:hypothetical protein